MPKSPYAPCIPTRGTKVPSHSDWIHEVKQDGFRLIVSRVADRVRLFTRNGYDWTTRYPLIVEAARRIRTKQFVLDGEAVLLGVDGISNFDGLYSGQHNDEIQLYAFDILALDGDDLRKLPLHLRKTNLARLLARRADGIHLPPFEQGEIGPDLFRAACDMMLEGLVSKRRDSPSRPQPVNSQISSSALLLHDPEATGIRCKACCSAFCAGCVIVGVWTVYCRWPRRRDAAGLMHGGFWRAL
jgi:bifunctional non-homologous end joining protein LigD